MARSENSQESNSPENTVTKTLFVSDNSNDDPETTSTRGECVFANCSHTNKAIDINQVRKGIENNGGFIFLRCVSCKSDLDGEKGLTLCMRCGECCCTDHIERHFKTPRSDSHLLFTDINNWSTKCAECDVDIPTDSSGKLTSAILLLKNIQSKSKSTIKTFKPERASASTAIDSSSQTTFAYRNSELQSSLAVMISTKPTSSLLPPRGLSNLGNTCFFNSVLQCLARTPFLLETLLEMKEPGEKVVMKPENHEPIEVELHEKWGPVTENLISTLLQITMSTGNAHSPGHLLDALRKKQMQFMGYNQHDAHELLRTLLDCVKNEDMRRYRVEILRYFGLSRKTNPEEMDEKKKALAKEMDKKLSEIVNIRPDPVFRGTTVSANQCIKCSYKSEIPESFLDLSLPVSFLRLQPLSVSRRKNDFGEKPKSKHQLKKERKQARRNKNLAKVKKRCAVVEDKKCKNVENRPTEIKDINESGYSSDKASSPIQSGNDIIINNENNNEILAEALNEISTTQTVNAIEDCSMNVPVQVDRDVNLLSSETPCSDGATIDRSLVDTESNGTPDRKFNGNEIASTSCYSTKIETTGCNSSLQWRLVNVGCPPTEAVVTDAAITGLNSFGCHLVNSSTSGTSKIGINISGGSSSSDEDDLEDENEDDDNDAGDSDEDDESFEDNVLETRGMCTTLQPPITDIEENSIWACLREYTKCEVLTGNNKVMCEKCTKDYNKNTGDKKHIYRNFTKQLLVKSPPPVLILHLKRFEAKGAFSFRKVDTSISFPLTLDIGSFCSVTCEKLLYADQKNILYSLYGIVEHSGSLNAGHYVAYVKVRNTNKHSYRRLFLPKDKHDQTESLSDKDLDQIMNELKNEERQWYYISDSSVRPIAEEDVLRKQAYLLFYERIW